MTTPSGNPTAATDDDWAASHGLVEWVPAPGERVQVWNPGPYSTGTVTGQPRDGQVAVRWDGGSETRALVVLLRRVER